MPVSSPRDSPSQTHSLSRVAVEDRAAMEGIQLSEGLGREGGGLRGKTKSRGQGGAGADGWKN